MVFITAEAYKDAGVDIITVKKKQRSFFGKNERCGKKIGYKKYVG